MKEKIEDTIKTTKTITTIDNYPDDGNRQECEIGIPAFEIRKGEDGYFYLDKNRKQKAYNIEEETTKLWIVNLIDYEANDSLQDIFYIKTSRNVDVLIDYCVKLYKRSLGMEIKRYQEELKILNNEG